MMLDPAILAEPLLDHQRLDLTATHSISFVVEQSFRYTYSSPVESLRQRLVVTPPQRHGGQHLRAHRLDVAGAPARRRIRHDRHGNTIAFLQADEVEGEIEFRFAALVERVRREGLPVLPTAVLEEASMLRPTRLTEADERLQAMADEILAHAECARARAERICGAVAGALSYADGVTTVETTAAEALAGGRGVCQDYAHVMLALCHLVQLPARYVSGHLPGQGGTHAWVEVLMPRIRHAVAVPFDPCNGTLADDDYLTVATGRDYSDVAPVSGSYHGSATNQLVASRRVGVIAAA